MRIGSTIGQGWVRLAAVEVELSGAARRRLKWMDYYRAWGQRAPDLSAFRHQRASLVAALQSPRLDHAGEPFAEATAFASAELKRGAD